MLRQETIFVTGASGLIGKATVRYLLEKGYAVKALLRSGSLSPFYAHKNLRIVRGSMEEILNCVSEMRGCEAVVNLAANQYPPTESFVVNVKGVAELIEAMKKSKVTRLI